MIIGIDLKKCLPVPHMPAGTCGRMSFEKLVELMEDCHLVEAGQVVTHMTIDVERGMIAYRVETPEG